MRHGDKINNLSRTASHRHAMLSNMASSLILHKRIFTTVAKAKALRKYVEPLLTKSKNDTTHSRRLVFAKLENKEVVAMLFREVADKIANRPGGYTRIIKTGSRLGDNADMCMIELVDFNDLMVKGDKKAAAEKPKATRRKRAAKPAAEGAASTEASAEEKPKKPRAKKADKDEEGKAE